ncbi:MAG: hypothetical protein JW940_18550 [Polyangiaceae bacterium]|nr:hypothetical protein [Polyangiaceae bacterium]
MLVSVVGAPYDPAITEYDTEQPSKGFLAREREIIEGNIHQCLEHPKSVSMRVLLAETLLAVKRASAHHG